MTVVRPASNAVAPTVPNFAYIAPANNGNTAAKDDRMALFAAIADAAIGRYAVTRYVKVEVKTKYIPAPKGIEPMMGTIQWIPGYVVNANQNKPRIVRTSSSVTDRRLSKESYLLARVSLRPVP